MADELKVDSAGVTLPRTPGIRAGSFLLHTDVGIVDDLTPTIEFGPHVRGELRECVADGLLPTLCAPIMRAYAKDSGLASFWQGKGLVLGDRSPNWKSLPSV